MGQENSKVVNIRKFLETTPPNQLQTVTLRIIDRQFPGSLSKVNRVIFPEIFLYCDDEKCEGERYFKTQEEAEIYEIEHTFLIVTFTCKNCGRREKNFSLKLIKKDMTTAEIYKLGELPIFGPPIPSKLISLVGKDRETFLQGWRAEKQSMGIGAFAYYRRVVENQTGRIFDKIIKSLEKVGDTKDIIEELKVAKKETQFTKAVESIKLALPQILYIEGHNPLTLLHKALSEGIHVNSDSECLELATSIRLVLTALSERMSHISSEKKEMKDALSKLINRKK